MYLLIKYFKIYSFSMHHRNKQSLTKIINSIHITHVLDRQDVAIIYSCECVQIQDGIINSSRGQFSQNPQAIDGMYPITLGNETTFWAQYLKIIDGIFSCQKYYRLISLSV